MMSPERHSAPLRQIKVSHLRNESNTMSEKQRRCLFGELSPVRSNSARERRVSPEEIVKFSQVKVYIKM
jgi:hypothetical protein